MHVHSILSIYPNGEKESEAFREEIEGLKFRETSLLYKRKGALSRLKHMIKQEEEDIKDLTYGPYQEQEEKEQMDGMLKFKEKLLELYKLKKEYYECEIQAAKSKR